MSDDLLQLFENAGVSLPNENSLGEKIVLDGDSEKLLNFWNWFGDSKMVDNQGRPLVVYHGTPKKFDASDRSKSKNDFFFTPHNRRNTMSGYYTFYDSYTDGVIMPCYISMKNPLVIHRPNGKEEEQARKDGSLVNYDGIVAIYDNDKEVSSPQHDIEYIVFNPKQIKIIDENNTLKENLIYKGIRTKPMNEATFIAYHGSPNTFSVFSYDFIGKGNDEKGPGFYFTSNKEDAQMYGKVGEYKITLNKLVSTKKKASIDVIEKIISLSENCNTIEELVEKYENDEELWWDSHLSNYNEFPYAAIQEAIRLSRQHPNEYEAFLDLWAGVYGYNNKKFLQVVSNLGYDGVIFNVANDTTHFIVFNPNRIKLVKRI